MHSDMDSFILHNAEIHPSTDVKALALEHKKFINEKSSVQIQEIFVTNDITDTQGKLMKPKVQISLVIKFLKLLMPAIIMKSFGIWNLMDLSIN